MSDDSYELAPTPRRVLTDHVVDSIRDAILSGKIRLLAAKSDGSDRNDIVLEAGDFVYVPSGAIHVIANASQTEEASLVFCYIGVPHVEAAGNVWLTEMHDRFVAA